MEQKEGNEEPKVRPSTVKESTDLTRIDQKPCQDETTHPSNNIDASQASVEDTVKNNSSGNQSPNPDLGSGKMTEMNYDEPIGVQTTVSRRRSPSRDSSINDDPKSLFDSISAASGRQNWSGKDVIEEESSLSSIKGDSVSATIADYNKKHRAQYVGGLANQGDNQSRTSATRLSTKCGSSSRNDDLSVNINFYPFPTSGSTSEIANLSQNSSKLPDDIGSSSPVALQCSASGTTSWSNGATGGGIQAGTDSFDLIEESNDVSSCEDLVDPHSATDRGLNNLQSDGSCSNYSQAPHMLRAIGTTKSSHHQHRHHKPSHYHHHHHNQQYRYHKRISRGERRSREHRRSSAAALEHALEIDDIPQEVNIYQMEPIILRGNGNLTLFGLSNSFNSEFPSALIGRVSKEEFNNTIRQVNKMLREQQSLSAKLLLFGGLFCCCSFGFSLIWPSIVLRKRSKMNLEKFLASENCTLYSKLGLNWKLAEQRCYSNHSFIEYVIMIEFLPKVNLYAPD